MTNLISIKNELEGLRSEIDAKIVKLNMIDKSLKEQEKRIKYTADFAGKNIGDIIEDGMFLRFFKKPYAIIPHGRNKVLVAVPKFIKNFQVGWLWKETDNFYIYQLDQYSAWLSDIPRELLDEIDFKKEFEATIEGNTIFFNPSQKDTIMKKLGIHIADASDSQARIKKGHIFDIVADCVKNGCLPFKARRVSKEDLREVKSSIKLRPYQAEAYSRFLETGAVGIFHPTGAGKSFISLYAIDSIKGKKLIGVPTKTLVEQWKYYIDKYIPHAKDEINITTYQGYRASKDDDYALVVFDECQRLPANTFSRLAFIKTKYRIGLSASPHREDGRENFIFALTGFPVGMNWQEYMKTANRQYHPIFIHIVKSVAGKLRKAEELVDRKKKTLIYCDTISIGKEASNRLGVPYIYGQSSNRISEVEGNMITVVSRVMDLGISIKDLQRIIEIDFLFGSRQQELQRTGRLMHSDKAERHDIIMTEKEITQYGKRLWALQEKGFTVKVVS